MSETEWAQRFLAEGNVLVNQWSEHKPGQGRRCVPAKRLWAFTLAQALADDLALRIACRRCGLSLVLPLETAVASASLTTKLLDLRRAVSCPACGDVPCLRVSA